MGGFNASIPLSAFPDNEFDPVKNKMRLAQLLGANQENQIRAMQMSELQRQQAQQANVRSAAQGAVTPAQSSSYQEPTMQLGDMAIPGKSVAVSTPASFDQQKMYQNLLGTDPLAAEDMQGKMQAQQAEAQKQQMALQEGLMKLSAAKRAEAEAQLEQSVKRFYGVMALPPEQRSAAYQQEVQNQLNDGIIHPQQVGTEVPAQYSDQGVMSMLQRASSIGDILKQIKEQQDAVGLSPEEAAALGKKPGERVPLAMKNTANEIVNRGNNPEAQSLKAWLAKNPGKDASDYTLWKAKNSPSAIINNSSPLAPDAVDLAAQYYLKTGTLPSGFSRDPAVTKSVINRAAQLGKEQGNSDIAFNKTSMESLKKMQVQRDAVVAFENTANKNLDLFLETAKPIVDSGSPFLNTPIRNISAKMVGSENMAAFLAARRVAINEIAKVTNNPTLSGQLSDSGRHEVESLSPENATLKQIYSVASILKRDMANRHQSYDQMIGDIQGRLKGGGNKAPVSTEPDGNDPFAQFGGRAH
jgi:hypothetical protein